MAGVWTITYDNGSGPLEQAAAAWGLTARPRIRTRDRSPTEFSFRMAGVGPETTLPFPFKAKVIIKQNRVFASGSWSGSGYVFTGYLATYPGEADGRGQGVTLVFKDAIWLMQNTVFQQQWYAASSPGSPWLVSRAILFMDINSWVPNTYQSVQWQINQIITYAASCGISIAAGTIDYSGWYLNYYHCRAISCWDAILKCLEPIADAKAWIDGSGATPVLNVRTRANIAAMSTPTGTGPGPITLPYKGVDSAGRKHYSAKGFNPRYDLVPPQVALQYQINNTYNNKSAPSWTNDVYPGTVGGSSDGQMPFAMVCPIDLTGASTTSETGTLNCFTLACVGGTQASKRAWWSSKLGGENAKLAITDTDAYKIRFGSNVIPDATVVDDNRNPINLANYPNRIISGTYHAWMKNGSTQINAIRAKISTTITYTKWDAAGSTPAETDTNGNQIGTTKTETIEVHVTLTNAPAGTTTFVGEQLTALAESPVSGLAQNIYNSRSVLDYDGSHEIIDPGIKNGASGAGTTAPLQQLIGHWNVLNFSGGASAWATANMTIAGTEIDLMTNHIRIDIGPSGHLQPQDWNSMLQFFRYRHLSIPSSVRATGYADQNSSIDMALNTPDANTVPGLDVNSLQALIGADSVDPTRSNVIKSDSSGTQIQVIQQNTSTNSVYTTGKIAPQYNGSGSPTSSTLAPNAYYRVGDEYLDGSGNALWTCKTAGSNSTSVWAQISGGGGTSTQQFRVISDGGDYWNCKTWDGTTLGSTTIQVAKPWRLRAGTGAITSETINRGTAVTYTYTYGQVFAGGVCVEYQRASSGSDGSSSTDYLTPPVLGDPTNGTIIVAVPFSSPNGPSTLSGVNWIYDGGEKWSN